MALLSSPVAYPPSSSPAVISKKRKLFQPFADDQVRKRGKFVEESLDTLDESLNEDHQVEHQRDVPADRSLPLWGTETSEESIIVDIDEIVGSAEERHRSPSLPLIGKPLLRKLAPKVIDLHTASGTSLKISLRTKSKPLTYEETIAQRSAVAAGRAKKAYYGIEIHKLIDEARIQQELNSAQIEFEQQAAVKLVTSIEASTKPNVRESKKSGLHQMWTEKYRAKKFTELVGDERTHRSVLRWLKAWDDVVFSRNTKPKTKKIFEDKPVEQEYHHRKILLLTGPPGLGKTTLAHVCAKQAGYGILEINASDDRSRDVVKGRIKDALSTETARGIQERGQARKAGRPACVVVDEVDGVVTGSSGSGGEGGFIKALIDLVQLDQRNSSAPAKSSLTGHQRKGDNFRLLRPLILICNDVYAPSLRPLRTSGIAEIVHVRKPALDKVMLRLKSVFEKEGILCDNDAIRKLCESAWGLGSRKQNSLGGRGSGEGDIRGVLVQAEWMAHKFRSTLDTMSNARLTRKWMESHFNDSQSANAQKGMGRGGVREVVDRVFIEGAGLPNLPTAPSVEDARLIAASKANPIGVADLRKRAAISALREMIDTCGDHDRLVTDCFATYPTKTFQDDIQLSKPNACYDWLHFHDSLSSRIFSGQEWELNPYLNTAACGFHHLFAAIDKGPQGWNNDETNKDNNDNDVHPFGGSKADFAAYEAEKQNRTTLVELQSSFAAPLLRLFPSIENIAAELMPNIARMLAPEVKPVVVGGSGGSASVASVRKESERNCVKSAVRVMNALNVSFEKVKIETETSSAPSHGGGFVYRMEPPLDMLSTFHMDKHASATTTAAASSAPAPVRYAVRQVLDQEYRKEQILLNSHARHARSSALAGHDPHLNETDADEDKENHNGQPRNKQNQTPQIPVAKQPPVKRDFFGRVIVNDAVRPDAPGSATGKSSHQRGMSGSVGDGYSGDKAGGVETGGQGRVWVSFHEGFSNAVRKPITLKELLDSF